MKPYWRAESRRFEAFETTHGWIDSRVGAAWFERSAPVVQEPRLRVLAPTPPAAPTFDAARFARAFEAALAPGDAALAALARCGAGSIARGFRCGSERAVAPWCGSPLCAPCAGARAQEAGRVARQDWSATTILVADAPLRAKGPLPAPAEVVRARDGFARAARRLEVEGLARAVVTPDGVRFFAAAPAGDAALTATALERLLRKDGVDATVAAVGRDEAARRLEDALTLEARRFRDAVTRQAD
ncbi:MAG: hypothetical protein KF878_35845, partial [Planctomycetes bacterium]|nr:hypothetical protein [Planctomycetota bacterium]